MKKIKLMFTPILFACILLNISFSVGIKPYGMNDRQKNIIYSDPGEYHPPIIMK